MILELKDIRGGYRKNTGILKGIDLSLRENEVLAIIGQNGSGKSTLAKAIMNVLPYRTGSVFFEGKEVTSLNTRRLIQRGIVYFMQGGRVFPHLTVKENMHIARMRTGTELLDEEMFPVLKKHWLDEAGLLSGGERHQLALAMALVKQPKLLVLDEPSAGLSPIATQNLYQILKQIQQTTSISIILIEQNTGYAVDFSNRIAIMQQGKIQRFIENTVKEQIFNEIMTDFF